jgi:hypothetical protein
LAYKPILRFEPSGIVTFGVWRKSLARGWQDESPTTRRLALCPVVASANTKAFQISHHSQTFFWWKLFVE